MRRSLFFLASCAVAIACSEHTIITKSAPGGEQPGPTEEEPAPPAPQSTEPLVVDLGVVQVGVDVPFDVPEGALGFNVVVEGRPGEFDFSRPFGIQRITDPNGKVVHDRFMPVGGTKSTSTAAFDTIAAASVPQSEAAASVPAGEWKVRFGVENDTTARPRLTGKVRIQSSGDGVFHGGKLSLHVHIPTGLRINGSTVDPSKAASHLGVKTRVDDFFLVLKELVGIDRGDVVFEPEPASLAEVADEEILEGFAVSSGAKDGAQELHVLFTNEISQGGQPVAHGIAPGIPGAANLFGRGVSGIIVATIASSDEDVLTMVHEMGHFIGLNHTTEFDGDSSDPLKDTPACTSIATGQLESCPDRANIMFPAGAIDGPIALSPTQKRVYRGSPVYTAFLEGTQKTQSLVTPRAVPSGKRSFRISGSVLSPAERELSLGFCGLTPIDAQGLLRRHGEGALRAAASDLDLSPIIRGRANVALAKLGLAK